MDYNPSFGQWLQQRRKALDLTQEELSQCVACSPDHVRNLEADRRRPSKEIAKRLAACLEIAEEDYPAFLRFARGESSAIIPPPLPAHVAAAPWQQPAPASSNLPILPTPLIGREHEVATVCALLRRPAVRLLTLTGPGGIGKTRLGLQIAMELRDAFADGIFFVPLAPLRDPALVISTVAQTLGVWEAGSQSLLEHLKVDLHAKQILLLLDNFEHLLQAAPLIIELLAAVPRLKVLVTSRTLLHVSGEHTFPVPALALPDVKRSLPRERLIQSEAVTLFIARAQAVKPDFQVTNVNAPVVGEICCRLDGLPLAIELAAARIRLLPPQELLKRLSNPLKLLTGGARDLPMRQQTLRNTIDWSYNLLNQPEQVLFARLAIFMGGCTLEAVERVCNVANDVSIDTVDGLQALVDTSMLQQGEGVGGESRFSMLETIREYALERLMERGEAEVLRHQHATYYLALTEAVVPELAGAQQGIWPERLEEEHDNLRAALEWSAVEERAADVGVRLVSAVWRFWEMRGYFTEGRRWLQAMLTRSAAHAPTQVLMIARARALHGASVLASWQGDVVQATLLGEQSLAVWRAVGDVQGIAQSLTNLGLVAQDQGDVARASTLLTESLGLFREVGDQRGIAQSLTNLGVAALYQGDQAQATALWEESLILWRELEDTRGIARALTNLGLAKLYQGEYKQAAALFEEGLLLFQGLGDQWSVANALSNLGNLALSQGDIAQAQMCYKKSLALFQELADRGGIAECLEGLARVATAQEQLACGARLFGAAHALRAAIDKPLPPTERSIQERTVADIRAKLGADQFAAAWEAGRTMALEQVIVNAGGSISLSSQPANDHNPSNDGSPCRLE